MSVGDHDENALDSDLRSPPSLRLRSSARTDIFPAGDSRTKALIESRRKSSEARSGTKREDGVSCSRGVCN